MLLQGQRQHKTNSLSHYFCACGVFVLDFLMFGFVFLIMGKTCSDAEIIQVKSGITVWNVDL